MSPLSRMHFLLCLLILAAPTLVDAKHKDEPFFVYLATNAPHWPWNVKKEWRDAYGDSLKDYEKGRKRSLADFYATITRVDENIGRLRKFLADEELERNTILISRRTTARRAAGQNC